MGLEAPWTADGCRLTRLTGVVGIYLGRWISALDVPRVTRVSDGVCLKTWNVVRRWQKELEDVAGTKRDDQIFGICGYALPLHTRFEFQQM